MKKIILFVIFLCFVIVEDVNAATTGAVAQNFCADITPGIKVFGYIIFIVKILVPLCIVAMGTFDIYKVISTGKVDDLKKQFIVFSKRIMAGLIIFFLPAIINLTLSLFVDEGSDMHVCTNCLFNPGDC